MTNPTLSATIGQLDTLRRIHGHKSDVGVACSNLIQGIKELQISLKDPEDLSPKYAAERRECLVANIAHNQARLAGFIVEQRNRQAGEG